MVVFHNFKIIEFEINEIEPPGPHPAVASPEGFGELGCKSEPLSGLLPQFGEYIGGLPREVIVFRNLFFHSYEIAYQLRLLLYVADEIELAYISAELKRY